MKRIAAIIITVLMAFCMFPIVSAAADGSITTDGTYDISDYGNNATITIDPGLTVTLTNTGGTQFQNLQIKCGAGTDLTIDNLSIDDSLTAYACPLSFTGTGNTLNLIGSNTFKAGKNMPGIKVSDGASLEIMGTGSIDVTGNVAAGIGGGYNSTVGSITISSGTVTATSGEYAAGIGGGHSGSGGSITISGGTVTATGDGAGIGGGNYSNDAGTITISSGTVTATSIGYGAGIGGGQNGGAEINISGGTIDATGAYGSAGIGSGWYGAASTINISGGNILNATGGSFGPGIGGGDNGEAPTINISDGTVNAIGGYFSAGIGGAKGKDGGSITISGGTVITQGGTNGAGIGGGSSGSGGTIRIEGGTVKATGGPASAGIGGGHSGSGGSITILNGDVTTTGRWGGAGIGSGPWHGDGGNIKIEGGNVTATGGNNSAGIGGGFQCGGGNIVITGGTIAAKMGDFGQHDIGDGGDGGMGGTFNISGNAVAFLKNNSCIPPITVSHTKFRITEVTGGQVYGNTVPDGWTPEFGVLIDSYTLNYDANGGIGTVPETVTQPDGISTSVADGSGLSNGRLRLINWNTAADLSGTIYPIGSSVSFTADTTLYANWQRVDVSSVTLSQETMTMLHHDTAVLTAEVLPNNASYPEVTWESSDSEVVTVDQSGNLEAVGLGSAVITATADGVSDTCVVTVNKRPVTSVTLSEETLTMVHHDTGVLTAEVLPSNATYPEVTWESSNTEVVTVDQNGNIEAVGLGNGVITATADGISDTCNITVNKKPVESITLSKETIIMEHHDTATLTVQVLPTNATYPQVTWESSDDTIVSVDQNGKIAAINLGVATITATADGLSDICVVTVNKKPVASVTLNSTDETVFVGDVVTLAADVLPINATYNEITWKSSDESLAVVDENGVVTTIKGGNVRITASADGVSADCNIFIIQPVTSVTLSSSSKTMIHHDTLTLASNVLPDDATYPEVTWSTSNKNVATVNQDGKVIAVGVGSATITSTADGISDICVITVNKKPVTDVALNENELSLVHHDTVILTAEVTPSNATYQEITWVSSNTSVVTIDETGSVLAVGVGSAEITATADDVTAVCNVTVEKKPVASVKLNETALTLNPDGTFELIVSVMPSNVTYPQVTWESSDPSVAEIDDTGVVTAMSTGSAVVTVEADGIAAACEVIVEPVSKKTVTITGVLTDDKGKPLAGKAVELHSDPMLTVTDSEGRFTFEDVCVEHHTLIIKDNAGDPIKEFEIDLNTKDDFKWEEDEDTCVNIMLSNDTAAVELSISLNNEDFGITDVQDVTYPSEEPSSKWEYILFGGALLLAVLVVILVTLMVKRRKAS